MRAVIYARVSGDDRGSLAGQLEMGREYAATRGYTVVAELSEEWVSGASMDAPELQRALEMARAGAFDVLVVREMDRLARDLVKQMVIEGALKSTGVAIEYVLGEYPDTPEGTLNKQIRAVISEYERQKITERSIRGRIAAARKGHVLGGRAPYGYRFANDGVHLEIDEAEANVIRMIFTLYTQGNGTGEPFSAAAIADKLSARNVPTWADTRGTVRKYHPYGVWVDRTIMRILHNKTYCGEYTWREIAVTVPAIIDVETWETAQRQCAANRSTPVNPVEHQYLFQGRVRCGECGGTVYSVAQMNAKPHPYFYYRCGDKIKGRAVCTLPGFNVHSVDNPAWEWITGLILDQERLNAGLAALRGNPAWDETAKRHYIDAQQRAVAASAQLTRIQDMYQLGHLSRDDYITRRLAIEENKRAAEQEQRDIEYTCEQAEPPTEGDLTNAMSFATAIREELLHADFPTRRRIVTVLDTVTTLYTDRRIAVDIGLPRRLWGGENEENYINKTSYIPRIRLRTTLTITQKRPR